MSKTWVVYRRPMMDDPFGTVGVCTAAEWAAMKPGSWGSPVLVQSGFATEGEAERAARQETMKRGPQAGPGVGKPDEEA
jgi:hypothetical protein